MSDREIKIRLAVVGVCFLAAAVAWSRDQPQVACLFAGYAIGLALLTAIRLKMVTGRTSDRK